jgi:malate dehydrogenase (oxaloacetate-decarboxylating)(NADP+)
VITNGTAVLGLGAIGPLAAKPVMEGKSVLFKKFAGIDVFDIEVSERDPEKLVEIIASLEPTFGGINLEDIKAPECFIVERKLRARMKIPVFHDDQHGTAIIVGAAILNGLKVVGKDLKKVKLVASGAGAAAIACLNLLVEMGLPRGNIVVTDIKGVVYRGRTEEMDPEKERFAVETRARTLSEVIDGADVFLGVSAGGVLKPEMVKRMGARPLILALANPEPEIRPEVARAAKPDAVIATGRSDYPNQVNNVLCFPFVFRGALDVGASAITREMELAAVTAIAELAQAEQSDIVARAYGDRQLSFGPDYLIPRPFDPRLIGKIAPAVARAAMASGVATRPIADLDAYRERLNQFVYQSGLIMKPVFEAAKASPRRVVYAEGEDERVLRAAQVVVDEGMARPTLVGRREVVQVRIERLGLRLKPEREFDLVDPNDDPRYREYSMAYHKLAERKGVTPQIARLELRRRTTLIGAMLVHMGAADAMLCGVVGHYVNHLRFIDEAIGLSPGARNYAAMNMLLLPRRTVFICDTYVNYDPTAEQIAEMTVLAAEEIRRFGITPRVALLSHSSFGTANTPTAAKMRRALALIGSLAPGLEVDGEMQGDAALSEEIRARVFPNARLTGEANLLVMPTLDAANIAFNLLKTAAGDGITVGPILLGVARPVHILTPSATVRRIVNMTALTVVDAAAQRGEQTRLL